MKILTLRQAAEILQVSERTMHRFIREGGLKAHKVGRQWRLTEEDVIAFARGTDREAKNVIK